MTRSQMLRELLSLTQQFLLQQPDTHVPCDAEMRNFINAERRTQNAERNTTAPQHAPALKPERGTATPQQMPAPAPKPVTTILTKELPTQETSPKEQAPKELPQRPAAPVLRSAIYDLRSTPAPDFYDLKAKLKGLGLQVPVADTPVCDEEAKKKCNAWKANVPQVIVVSFFPLDSAQGQVVKNLTTAIHTKLTTAQMIFSPGKEALTELLMYAQAKLVKAIFFASDRSLKSKINEFLLPLELEEQKEKGELLESRGLLFDTALFDLQVSETLSSSKEEKQAVWNALKAAI